MLRSLLSIRRFTKLTDCPDVRSGINFIFRWDTVNVFCCKFYSVNFSSKIIVNLYFFFSKISYPFTLFILSKNLVISSSLIFFLPKVCILKVMIWKVHSPPPPPLSLSNIYVTIFPRPKRPVSGFKGAWAFHWFSTQVWPRPTNSSCQFC